MKIACKIGTEYGAVKEIVAAANKPQIGPVAPNKSDSRNDTAKLIDDVQKSSDIKYAWQIVMI